MLASLLLTAAAGDQRLIRCCKTSSALLHQAPACRQRKTCIDPWSKVQCTSSKEQYTWSKKQYTQSKVQRTGPYSLPSQHTFTPGADSVEAQALHYCIMNQTEKLPFLTLDPRHIVHFRHAVFAPNFMNELRLSLRASLRETSRCGVMQQLDKW